MPWRKAAEGDSIRITFKNQKIVVAANDYEITDGTGWIFQTSIRQTMRGTDGANTTVPDVAGTAPTAVEVRQEIDSNSTRLDADITSRAPASEYDTEMARITGNVALESSLGTHDTDIKALLPAALVSGRMSSDAVAISGSTIAADKLKASAETIVIGAAVVGTLSTTQMTTNLTEATDDHYNGRIIIWTSGTLIQQATDITDYDGATKLLTFTAVTEFPSDGDTFVIV